MSPQLSRGILWRRAFASLSILLLSFSTEHAFARSLQAGGDARVQANDFLNKGEQAFRKGLFDEAIEDFKRASDLDPSLLKAHLYIATAYANQYIPGAPSEENIQMGKLAIQEFQTVLATDPANLSAIDGIASITYSMAGTPFDAEMMHEAKAYHQKHVDMKPKDPQPYYWIGVIDWSIAYRSNKDLRQAWTKQIRSTLSDADPLPETVRQQFADANEEIIDEGIERLKQAMALRPDYDDAIAYLNLLYRLKAEMEPTIGLRDADLKAADDLVDEVKKIKNNKMGFPDSQ
jgi:tetratricopeptide (TPR) repeat protein